MVNTFFLQGNITVKDEFIYGHLRPWLGDSNMATNNQINTTSFTV